MDPFISFESVWLKAIAVLIKNVTKPDEQNTPTCGWYFVSAG